MTALQDPDAIRHFQSLIDACQDLIERWLLDPSSFFGPDGDPRTLFETERR